MATYILLHELSDEGARYLIVFSSDLLELHPELFVDPYLK